MSTLPEAVKGTRIVKVQEALRLAKPKESLPEKTSETPQQVCAAGKQPKEPMVRMTLPLFHRRKTMLITYHSGHLNPAALKQMAIEFECTEQALLDDLEDRENWEPFIWANQEAHEDGKALLHQLQLAREEALFLMKTCKSANARVGAIGKFIDSIKAEVEVGQSLGLLPKQISPTVVVQQNNVTQVNTKTETKLMIDMTKMSEDDRKALLRAEEALARAETATGPQ